MKKKQQSLPVVWHNATFFLMKFVILLWVVVALGRALYNDSKIFTQDKYLFTLNSSQRQRETYGEIAFLASKLPSITHGEPILVTGNDGGLYFFLRYLLYPQKVYWVNS